jgi:hypothetical protein
MQTGLIVRQDCCLADLAEQGWLSKAGAAGALFQGAVQLTPCIRSLWCSHDAEAWCGLRGMPSGQPSAQSPTRVLAGAQFEVRVVCTSPIIRSSELHDVKQVLFCSVSTATAEQQETSAAIITQLTLGRR